MSPKPPISKVSSNFRITLPPEVREEMKIEEGDIVAYIKERDKYFLKKIEIEM